MHGGALDADGEWLELASAAGQDNHNRPYSAEERASHLRLAARAARRG
jgi:hypothetical protein